MDLKPGSRWKSAVCTAEFVVVRPPSVPGELACGGHPVLAHGAVPPPGLSPSPEPSEGSQAGKRYGDAETGLEVLCAKAGASSLSLSGRPMAIRDAKKLPSSD
jgi:hypothetical protein